MSLNLAALTAKGNTARQAASAPAITAAPTAKLTFDQPRVSTTSGQTGIATPYAGGNPTPITAPSYVAGGSPSRYQANSAPVYNTPITAPQAQNSFQPPAESFAPPPPPPPPAPPVGGRTWYNNLRGDEQANVNANYLGGDSDYNAQITEYDRALETFVDRIMNQKKMFNQDANDAVASTGRNQAMTLDSLGEDFGARGLSYSGMFDTTKNQTNERFNDAKGGIEKVRSRNLSDADNREADYRTENKISRGNAERSALSRQAQRQALLDSMAGF